MPLFYVLDCAQAVLEATELQGQVGQSQLGQDRSGFLTWLIGYTFSFSFLELHFEAERDSS